MLPLKYIDANEQSSHAPTIAQIPKGETALLLAEAPLICMLVKLLHHTSVTFALVCALCMQLRANAVHMLKISTARAVLIATSWRT